MTRSEFELHVVGPGGRLSVRDVEPRELDEVAELLALFDGRVELGQAARRSGVSLVAAEELVRGLAEIGAVHESSELWRWWFSTVACNPPAYPPSMTAEQAYALSSWAPPSDSGGVARIVRPTPDSAGRRSPDLAGAPVLRPGDLLAAAIQVAADILCRGADGHLRWSSAGAMWPLSVFVVAKSDDTNASIQLVDPASSRALQFQTVSLDVLCAGFVRDHGLLRAIGLGAPILVVAADAERMCAKYGNRGLTYCYIEAGQLLAHLERELTLSGLRSRPIGGFYERHFQKHVIPGELLPLLCVVITDGT